MANLISSNSSTGVYIVEDQGGWVAANTPNTCDLALLTLAQDYMYFADVVSLTHTTSTPDNDNYFGWDIQQDGATALKSKAFGGMSVMRGFVLVVNVDSTEQKNFEKFFDYYQVNGEAEKYLVRQWASTTFKEFSYNATNYKYSPVILVGYELVELAIAGKDVQALSISLAQANRQT